MQQRTVTQPASLYCMHCIIPGSWFNRELWTSIHRVSLFLWFSYSAHSITSFLLRLMVSLHSSLASPLKIETAKQDCRIWFRWKLHPDHIQICTVIYCLLWQLYTHSTDWAHRIPKVKIPKEKNSNCWILEQNNHFLKEKHHLFVQYCELLKIPIAEMMKIFTENFRPPLKTDAIYAKVVTIKTASPSIWKVKRKGLINKYIHSKFCSNSYSRSRFDRRFVFPGQFLSILMLALCSSNTVIAGIKVSTIVSGVVMSNIN